LQQLYFSTNQSTAHRQPSAAPEAGSAAHWGNSRVHNHPSRTVLAATLKTAVVAVPVGSVANIAGAVELATQEPAVVEAGLVAEQAPVVVPDSDPVASWVRHLAWGTVGSAMQ
jgi:hypothetical protein